MKATNIFSSPINIRKSIRSIARVAILGSILAVSGVLVGTIVVGAIAILFGGVSPMFMAELISTVGRAIIGLLVRTLVLGLVLAILVDAFFGKSRGTRKSGRKG